MNRFHFLLALSIFVATTALFLRSSTAAADIGCPVGQVVQGIDVETGKFVCVPGSGGTVAQLVDRDGLVVGQYMGHGIVSREINGYRVDICCITTTGRSVNDVSVAFLYSSANCEGARYFFADPTTHDFLFRIGSLLNTGDIVFGGDPITTITPLSYSSEFEGCVAITETGHENLPVQPALSVPLSSLGAPPFRVK
jgi:hypothetical protein